MKIANTILRIAFGCALYAFIGLTITAKAETITIVGNSTGSLATANVNCTFNSGTNTLTFTITNTSPFDARITGIGFDLVNGDFSGNNSAGLNSFSASNNAGFTFRNGALGNVPQFSNAVLDFGWTTGNAGNFSGGSPNDGIAPAASLIFSVSGTSFAGLTEEQICDAIFVRFQRVGPNGDGSDVGVPGTPVPEPATMLLFGTGLAGVVGALRRRTQSRV
ncbi:MAG: PEP-CTERM sorting domain-containing protein [Pyrinomonadaceae bacterium]|nr:PEP-CTERM sorting domain-containing protein [Pyrinomonadaceae bacterium]